MTEKQPLRDTPPLDPNVTFVPPAHPAEQETSPRAGDAESPAVPVVSNAAASHDPAFDQMATIPGPGAGRPPAVNAELDLSATIQLPAGDPDEVVSGDPDFTPTLVPSMSDEAADEAEAPAENRTVIFEWNSEEEANDYFSRTIATSLPVAGDDEVLRMKTERIERRKPATGRPDIPQAPVSSVPTRDNKPHGPASVMSWAAGGNSTRIEDLISIRPRPLGGAGQEPGSGTPDFDIVEKLAEGGMGVVYVARQRSLNRELAIKTLKIQGTSGSGSRAGSSPGSGTRQMTRAERQRRDMFLSEAVVTANLAHPNIVPIHDLCETETGVPYYVMKRVQGTPWNKCLRDMSLEENLATLDRVCDAVAYAHHHGVINRDLKPENVMLGNYGEVLVLDWGLAVPVPSMAGVNFRAPNATSGAGTPAYMAPELWTGPMEAITEASDIYLLGAILFEIITHFPPHQFSVPPRGGTQLDTWKAIDSVLRENRIRETPITGELMDIALRAMRSDPSQRYGSVMELQFAIRNFQRHEESRRLSLRASDLIAAAKAQPQGYQNYQNATALYEEALRAWKSNPAAARGLRNARLSYAQLAAEKGDFELALQVAAPHDEPEFVSLRKKVTHASRLRAGIKGCALATAVCVVLLGLKSIYDNGVIVNLNREVALRRQEADRAVQVAADAGKQARLASEQAAKAQTDAELAQREADASRAEADAAKTQAAIASEEAALALKKADIARADAEQAAQQAAMANRAVEEAMRKVAEAERSEAAARDRQTQAEIAARVANVEIQNQVIRSLALNQNYSDAIREINRLLNGDLLAQLPDELRQQRTRELQAQREQLLRRSRTSDQPVQSQAVSPDGRRIVQADATGRLSVLEVPPESREWPEQESASRQLPAPADPVRFLNDVSVLLASDVRVLTWNIRTNAIETLSELEQPVAAVSVAGTTLAVADTSGVVQILDLPTKTQRAQWQVRTRIRDVALLPDERTVIVAGSRGDQSADILAWRLPTRDAADQQPERLGQLLLPRGSVLPPARLAVSPDGSFLAVSNLRNGDVLLLPARQSATPGSSFPFQSPVDLEQRGEPWQLHLHERPVTSLTWSLSGDRLLTASEDRTAAVWRKTPDGSPSGDAPFVVLRQLRGHGARVTQASFLDHHGERVVTVAADLYSRLWDLRTEDTDQREIMEAFHLISSDRPDEASVRPDEASSSTRIVHDDERGGRATGHFCVAPVAYAAGQDSGAIVINESSTQHRGEIAAVALLDQGRRIATAAAEGTVAIWNASDGTLVDRMSPEANDDRNLSERPAPRTLARADLFAEGHVFNVARLQVCESPSPLLISAGFDGTVRCWNLNLEGPRLGVQEACLSGLGLVNAFAVSRDGKWLATSVSDAPQNVGSSVSGDRPPRVRLWQIRELIDHGSARPSAELLHDLPADITALTFSADGQWLAAGCRDGRIGVISLSDPAAGSIVVAGHRKNTIVSGLSALTDGSLLSSGLDGMLLRWTLTPANPTDSAVLQSTIVATAGQGVIESFSVAPDDSACLLVCKVTDRRTRAVESRLLCIGLHHNADASGSPQAVEVALARTSVSGSRNITAAHWSSDSRRVIVAANDQLHVLSTRDWSTLRVVQPTSGNCSAAHFLPAALQRDGQDLVATFDGNSAFLWNLTNQKLITRFRGPSVIATVASGGIPGTEVLASGGRSLRIFSLTPGPQFGRVLFRSDDFHAAPMTAVASCPSSPNLFVSADSAGSLRVWQWNPEASKVDLRQTIDTNQRLTASGDPGPGPARIVALRWAPEGTRLLVVFEPGDIAIHSRTEHDLLNPVPEVSGRAAQNVQLQAAAWSPDGQKIAVSGGQMDSGESTGWIFALPGPAGDTPASESSPATAGRSELPVVCRFAGHSSGGISGVDFLPDSPYLVSGGRDGAVIVWNWQQPLPGDVPQAYECLRFFAAGRTTAHQAAITALQVLPDGRILSASADGTAVVWQHSLLHL